MSDILSDLGDVGHIQPQHTLHGFDHEQRPARGLSRRGTTIVTNATGGGYNATALITPSAFTSISNPFPTGIVPTLGASQGLQSLIGPRHLIPEPEPSRTLQSAVEFQHRAAAALVNGPHDRRSPCVERKGTGKYQSQRLTIAAINTASNSTASVPNPFKGLFLPSPVTSDNTATNINPEILMTAFPQFGSVTEDGMNSGTTQYNGLQTTVESGPGMA